MVKKDHHILTDLISFFGVSGRESRVREYIRKQIAPYVDSIKVDNMGNLIAHKKGKGPKVMVTAHMDEIGLMVKRITTEGFLYCTAMGGIDPISFISSPVHIPVKGGNIHGFITTEEQSSGKYMEKVPTIETIFVDTGLTGKELKKRGVEIGTYVHLNTPTCCTLQGDLIMGKALDNRIGCYIVIELAKLLKRSTTNRYFVFTVQEEFGLYGAQTSAFQIEPDWGIVVDTTQANDVFPSPSRWIGKGPCITVKDGEFISNPCIVGWMKDIARKNKIPYQLEAAEEGTTDATTIQTTKGGVPTAVLSIPVRNIHTTSGIAHMKDVEFSIKLLAILMRDPPHHCIV